jgi:hypothetical protein
MKHVPVNVLSNASRVRLERKDANEPTLAEINKQFDLLMKNWEETKTTQRSQAQGAREEGLADVLLEEKLTRLDADFAEKHKTLQKRRCRRSRRRPTVRRLGGNGSRIRARAEEFNVQLKAHASVCRACIAGRRRQSSNMSSTQGGRRLHAAGQG